MMSGRTMRTTTRSALVALMTILVVEEEEDAVAVMEMTDENDTSLKAETTSTHVKVPASTRRMISWYQTRKRKANMMVMRTIPMMLDIAAVPEEAEEGQGR